VGLVVGVGLALPSSRNPKSGEGTASRTPTVAFRNPVRVLQAVPVRAFENWSSCSSDMDFTGVSGLLGGRLPPSIVDRGHPQSITRICNYRKFSTNMRSLLRSSICEYKIHFRSGETERPSSTSFSILVISVIFPVAKLKNWIE
jgi:hypothetical protein